LSDGSPTKVATTRFWVSFGLTLASIRKLVLVQRAAHFYCPTVKAGGPALQGKH